MSALWASFSGLLFGAGLVVSQMTLTSRVQGFLDFAGDWDPSLAFVMVSAVLVHGLLRRPMERRNLPETASLTPRGAIDGRLISGAAVFGVGWGLFGYCPGPAVVSLGGLSREALVYVPAMIFGMWLFRLMERALTHQQERRHRHAEGLTATASAKAAAGDG